MGDEGERWGVQLLLNEAERFYVEGRNAEALRAAEMGREGARRVADIGLEVWAARVEATALLCLGRPGEALPRYSWILGVAEDPAHRAAVAEEEVAFEVVTTFVAWADCAVLLPPIQVDRLFEGLDVGERFARAIGRPTWRAGLLLMRAKVLHNLGRADEAIGFAEEALALALRDTVVPGASLGTHRWYLGILLGEVGRLDEARQLYQAVLDDPESSVTGDRLVALRGLHRCSLAHGDAAGARRLADEALRLAEPVGDSTLSQALEDVTDACLAQGDLPAARAASDRHVEVARSIKVTEHLFAALFGAVQVALAEGDPARAAAFLAEAQPHAEALDSARNRNHYRADLDRLRAQLAALEAALVADPTSPPPSSSAPPSEP